MGRTPPVEPSRVPSPREFDPETKGHPLRLFILSTGVLLIGFGRSLFDLARFAIHSQLYSYILLVPLISAYLGWIRRKDLPPRTSPAFGLAGLFGAAGLLILTGFWFTAHPGPGAPPEDSLALTSIAFVLLLLAVAAWFLGSPRFRALAFPLGFLVFLAPLPDLLVQWIEGFLQVGSAAVAYAFFQIAGMAVFYHDLIFQLPGLSLEIAPECSGIHSSLVLFITSLLAGHLFLQTPWKKAVLALAVVPLALLRNGFRVFVIGELCVRVGPEMIDSPIHRKGGPLFFALSLLPFFAMLLLLIRSDRRKSATTTQTPGT